MNLGEEVLEVCGESRCIKWFCSRGGESKCIRDNSMIVG